MSPEQIKGLRLVTRQSQEAWARSLGVATRTVSRWETGVVTPSGLGLRILQQYAEAVSATRKG